MRRLSHADLGRAPVLFRQPAWVATASEFEMLKFRSMRAPPSDGKRCRTCRTTRRPAASRANTTGRTRGSARSCARTSIDELPQLLTVLNGDMSLVVGPRPERPDFARLFEDNVYRYGDRHRVKSGITGWAQVNGLRGKTSLSDRVEWDNYYIENWSLWLDVKILLMTRLGRAAGTSRRPNNLRPGADPSFVVARRRDSAQASASGGRWRREQECGCRSAAPT